MGGGSLASLVPPSSADLNRRMAGASMPCQAAKTEMAERHPDAGVQRHRHRTTDGRSSGFASASGSG